MSTLALKGPVLRDEPLRHWSEPPLSHNVPIVHVARTLAVCTLEHTSAEEGGKDGEDGGAEGADDAGREVVDKRDKIRRRDDVAPHARAPDTPSVPLPPNIAPSSDDEVLTEVGDTEPEFPEAADEDAEDGSGQQ